MPKLVNNYISRHVAEKDSKSCVVCYRPTSHVLIADNKQDFLYSCQSHVKDQGFAKPIMSHPDHASFTQLETSVQELSDEAARLSKQIAASKSPLWSKLWDSSMSAKKVVTDDVANNEAPTPSVPQLKQLLAQVETRLKLKKEELANYQFKRFELDGGIFNSRIQAKRSVERERQKEKQMMDHAFFPKAPTGKIG